jgi:hypothetical protein
MTTPDIIRGPSSTEPDPVSELPDLAKPRTPTHAEGCGCPACLWGRLPTDARRQIRDAIDRRQAERNSADRRGEDRIRQ